MAGCGHVPRPGVCGGCQLTLEENAGLRPCPFCGSVELENLDAAAYGSAVHCINCGARGPTETAEGIADGLEAWNLRFEVS